MYLEDLRFKQAVADVVGKVRLEHALQQLLLGHIDAPEWHKVNPLNAFAFSDSRGELDSSVCGHFAKVMGSCRCDEELDVSNSEKGMFLENSSSELEEWHEQGIEYQLVVNILRRRLFEIGHDGLLYHEKLYAFNLIDTAETNMLGIFSQSRDILTMLSLSQYVTKLAGYFELDSGLV